MKWFVTWFVLALGAVAATAAENPAERVVVVANSNDPDSLRIARHYAERRGVPAANIIALPMATTETITWREFVLGVWQPLQDALVQRGWIDGIAMKLTDTAGRRKYAMSGHRIAYLVTCRGVPLRIDHDPALAAEHAPYTTQRTEFRTNRGAVDAELSLLAAGTYNINAFVRNPLFLSEQANTFEATQVVKVSRLDGPAAGDVLALIDRTLQAEQHGLMGRAYVDLTGPHKQGERWLESVAGQLEDLHFDLEVNRRSGTFPAGNRFDSPALYFGWYAGNVNGPFQLPNFRFPPGAVAVHIHSYSAHTLRSATAGWAGPLIARGAAATTGAVYEPYLELMHQPHLLLRRLALGETLGDAAYYAMQVLSWQNVLIGDPLYRPFAQSHEKQWRDRDELPALLRPYVALREMHRMETAGKPDEALALGRAELKRQPSLAVGLRVAQLLVAQERSAEAAVALGFASKVEPRRTDEWGLQQAAAELFATNGAPALAVETYVRLLKAKALPDEVRLAWLREAAKAATAAQNRRQATQWEREAAVLSAARETGK